MSSKFLEKHEDTVPPLVKFFYDRYGAVPKHIIFLHVSTQKIPYVKSENRSEITFFQKNTGGGSIVFVCLRFGFMEDHNVENVFKDLAQHHQLPLPADPSKWIIHASQERLVPSKTISLFNRLRLKLFLLLRQNSQPGYYYYGLGNKENFAIEIMLVNVS